MTEPVKIFIDNKSAIELSTLLNIRLVLWIIELHFIQSDLNVADIMTKQLSVKAHERHAYRLMNGFDGRPKEDLVEKNACCNEHMIEHPP